MNSTNNRILIVDDEEVIIQLYQAQLEDLHEVDIAQSGEAGLKLIEENEPYAVVISDMNMPGGMSGAEFLNKVRQKSPDSTRIMLTGAELTEVSERAVNEGQVFRFLTKPCPVEQLAKKIDEALEQYRIVRAEKELLDKTLSGSVSLLVDMLSIASPLAFGRSARIKKTVEELCQASDVSSGWEITLAAMLCEVGCISLPEELLEKVHSGEPLTASEQLQYAKHPELGSRLVSKIPRLEGIGRLISAQLRPYSEAKSFPEDAEMLSRASFLHVAIEYDRLLQKGNSPRRAATTIAQSPGDFSPAVSKALAKVVEQQTKEQHQSVAVAKLEPGMFVEEDICSLSGETIISKGQQLNELQISHLMNRINSIKHPILISGQAEGKLNVQGSIA